MKKIGWSASPLWNIDSMLQFQLGLMEKSIIEDLSKIHIQNDKFILPFIKFCQAFYQNRGYTFLYNGTKLTLNSISNAPSLNEKIAMMEHLLIEGLFQDLERLGIRTLFLIDGNNFFRSNAPEITNRSIRRALNYFSHLESDNENLKFIICFDNSILKLVNDLDSFHLIWQKFPVIVSRKGVQADEILISLYQNLGDRMNVKIVSRDNFREFRASVPELDDVIMPIHNLKELKSCIERGVLLDEI